MNGMRLQRELIERTNERTRDRLEKNAPAGTEEEFVYEASSRLNTSRVYRWSSLALV